MEGSGHGLSSGTTSSFAWRDSEELQIILVRTGILWGEKSPLCYAYISFVLVLPATCTPEGQPDRVIQLLCVTQFTNIPLQLQI